MTRFLIRLYAVVAVLLGGTQWLAAESFWALTGNCASSPSQCEKRELCVRSLVKCSYQPYCWRTCNLFELKDTCHHREAKRRGFTIEECTITVGLSKPKKILQTSVPLTKLNTDFNNLTKSQRKTIQSNLASGGYYKSTIDGLYGKNTPAALKAYNKEFLNDADLKKEKNVEALLQALINAKPNELDNRCSDNVTKSVKCRPSAIIPADEDVVQAQPETLELNKPEKSPLTIEQVKALYDADDFSKAFTDAQTLAVQGNAEAQLYLGKMYAD